MNVQQQRDFGHPIFSTDLLPAAERWPVLRDLYRKLANLEGGAIDDTFFANAKVGTLPGLKIATLHAGAFRATRSRAMVDQSDSLNLHICHEGVANISHLGREVTIGAGECILLTSTDPLVLDRSEARSVFLSIRKSVLTPMVPDIDGALMVPMRSTAEAFRLLQGYLGLLMADPSMVAGLGVVAAAHIQDLIALAIGTTRDAAELVAGRGLRAARLRAITADIDANLANGDVRSDALARRHQVSTRYIRKLFESEGTSLSQFVLGRRLALVHRVLRDPRFTHRTIGTIAFDAGFGDLSTFNHAFRRHFGMTPSELRQSEACLAAT